MKRFLITILSVLLASTPCLANSWSFGYGENSLSVGHSLTDNLGISFTYNDSELTDYELYNWLPDKPSDGGIYYQVKTTDRKADAVGLDFTYYSKSGVYVGVGIYEQEIYWQYAKRLSHLCEPKWAYYRDSTKEIEYPWSVGYRFTGDNMNLTLGYHELQGYNIGIQVKY